MKLKKNESQRMRRVSEEERRKREGKHETELAGEPVCDWQGAR